MSTLSDVDIKKEVIKGNLLIYPFQQKNLKGASYNLTVSKIAYVIPASNNGEWKSVYDKEKNQVIIPSQSTVLIATNETVYVDKTISGTYHSKVKQVSKGLSHIGTTLDPGYLGVSIIAVHNYTHQPIPLESDKDTFVSLVFRYVKTPAFDEHDNRPGRPDMLPELTEEEKEWFFAGFRTVKETLKIKLQGTDYYKLIKNENNQKWYWLIPYIICVTITIVGIILVMYLSYNSTKLDQYAWYSTVYYLADKLLYLGIIALITQFFNIFPKKDN